MPRLIHTIALIAAMVALAFALWNNWGIWATVKRMVLSYLTFFFLGGGMALIVRSAALFEKQPDGQEQTSSEET